MCAIIYLLLTNKNTMDETQVNPTTDDTTQAVVAPEATEGEVVEAEAEVITTEEETVA